jgi:hydroxymethylbilane synthase
LNALKTVTIATRKSPLALWQANHVKALLEARTPGLSVRLLDLSTEGDRFLQAPLAQVGGKGLFVKEIEAALLDGRADLAVHSLKDLTSEMPPELVLAATPPREDPRDAFVGGRCRTLAELPEGARVGTSSLRRACQLLEKRPDLEIVPLRGNVESRLRKTVEQGLHGAVLAYAGLKRLGLDARCTERLEPEVSLPAVGQGVLAVQCRRDAHAVSALVAALEDAPTRVAVEAERAFLSKLEGGCSVPLAAYAVLQGGDVWVRALIGSPDGRKVLRAERRGAARDAAKLGLELAVELAGRGGAALLQEGRSTLNGGGS